MNLSDQVAALENRIARGTRPWMRIAAAILLVTVTALLLWRQLHAPLRFRKPDAKASEQFGQALERAGIPTQAAPSAPHR
jgi:ABC-type nickel/cobalt efflux system permease component RcnA